MKPLQSEGLNVMGVKFGREYEDIVVDLTAAIGKISDCYVFFEMTTEEWEGLDQDEQQECLTTLADDIFFGLGKSAKIAVGSGTLIYNPQRHVITVAHGDNQVTIVNLI